MKMLIVSVRDAGVQAFLPPMFVRAKGEAMRGFIDACNDPKLPFGNHPDDYGLYLLGSFDDATGIVDPHSPELLMRAIEVMMQAGKSAS